MVDDPGVRIGVLDVTPTTSWADVTSASFYDPVTRAALPASMRLVSFEALNDHATATLYLQLKANAAEATTNAWRVPALSSLEERVWGAGLVTTLSHRASASGSAQLVTRWRNA